MIWLQQLSICLDVITIAVCVMLMRRA